MVVRIWIALVVLLLAAAHATNMPIQESNDTDVADVMSDDPPVIEQTVEPIPHTREAQLVPFVDEPMPASAAGTNVFRPPRPSID